MNKQYSYFFKRLKIFLVFFVMLVPGSLVKALTPNDPLIKDQSYLEEIGAFEAWGKTTGSEEVVIAVIDTGVDLEHPDLFYNIWINHNEIDGDNLDNDKNGFIDDVKGWNFVEDNNDPCPLPQGLEKPEAVHHGTVIAGLIAAQGNNAQGIAGLNWQAKIMPIRALNNEGQGKVSEVIEAVDYALANGADIINMSFVGSEDIPEMLEAVERAYKKGVMIVAAGGNDEEEGEGVDLDKNPLYPACYQVDEGENLVLGVGAIDALGQKASFSGFGHSCIDISAPGIDLASTGVVFEGNSDFSEPYLGGWSGTSISAALVSGAAALLKSYQPSLTLEEISSFLINNSDPLSNLKIEHRQKMGGKLNLAKALQAVESSARSGQALVEIKSQSEQELDLDLEFAAKQKGRLFLQVEDGGRIWYVDTNEAKRYEVTFANALPLFKSLSLGITNANLEKIPLAGGSGAGDASLRERLKGKLLLQVEDGGRIWFVDKVNRERYEVTWSNLIDLFGSLAVGITNADLYKIPLGAF